MSVLEAYLLIFFLLLFSLSFISSSSRRYKTVENPDWCENIKTTPEPKVLIYNRMPKCGSSSVNSLFEQVKIKNKFTKFSSNQKSWYIDFEDEKNRDLTKQFQKFTKHLLAHDGKLQGNPSNEMLKPVLLEGHWNQHTFNQGFFGANVSLEYIQLIRGCNTRRRSAMFYFLFESDSANKAKGNGTEAYDRYKRAYLDITDNSTTAETCIRDYDCLNRSSTLKTMTELQYLCGMKCTAEAQARSNAHEEDNRGMKTMIGQYEYEGALWNIFDPKAFAMVGLTEYFIETLEMLECMYPSFFDGIVSLYQNKKEHLKKNARTKLESSPALEAVLNETCAESGNLYTRLHRKATEAFLGRYEYMKSNKDTCCRSKRNPIERKTFDSVESTTKDR